MAKLVRIVSVFVVTCVFLAPAGAQPYGFLWLAPATESGYETSCNLVDNGGPICEVAVVLARPGSYTALSDFRVQLPLSSTWTYVEDVTDYDMIGNSHTGASVTFGQCLAAPIHVTTVRYLCAGTTPCSELLLGSALGQTEAVECDSNPVVVSGGQMTVNGVLGVPPGAEDPDCYCGTVPIEKRTWGAIKALYAN